eukprot:3180_1
MDAIFSESHYFEDQNRMESMPLIAKLLNYQLFKSAYDLHEYGQKLLNVYFVNKETLTIHYSILEAKYSLLFDIICRKEYQWIDINTLNIIFPNVRYLEIVDVALCSKTLQNVLSNADMFGAKFRMVIKCNNHSDFSAVDAVYLFKKRFKNTKLRISLKEVNFNKYKRVYDTLVIDKNQNDDNYWTRRLQNWSDDEEGILLKTRSKNNKRNVWFKCGKLMKIDNAKLFKINVDNECNTAYSVHEVSSGEHEWKIKIISQAEFVTIGISSTM